MQTNSIHSLLESKKDREYMTIAAILAAMWLVLWLTGCAKKTETGTSDTTTTSSATTPSTPESTSTTQPQTASNAAPQNMNDANIVAALSEADSAEITEAKLVMQKTKNPQVKAFAQMMITDHAKMKNEKAQLAKKLNITPQPPSNDQEPQALSSELSALNSASSPQAMDSIYVIDAVQDHTNDLSEAKQLQSEAQSPDLKNAIGSALPVIQKHLDHAKMIEQKLGQSSMAMGKKAR